MLAATNFFYCSTALQKHLRPLYPTFFNHVYTEYSKYTDSQILKQKTLDDGDVVD